MIKSTFHWSRGKIPNNTAFFAVGDIHGEWKLLLRMIEIIKSKVILLPKNTNVFLIFLGDYIDRGLDSKKSIDILINLNIEGVNIIFLCGNHDEIFKRVIVCDGLNDININKKLILREYEDLLSDEFNCLFVQGLTKWLYLGGGMSTVLDYCPNLSLIST